MTWPLSVRSGPPHVREASCVCETCITALARLRGFVCWQFRKKSYRLGFEFGGRESTFWVSHRIDFLGMEKVAHELGLASGAPQYPRSAYEERAKGSGAIRQADQSILNVPYHLRHTFGGSLGWCRTHILARRRVMSCSSPPVKASLREHRRSGAARRRRWASSSRRHRLGSVDGWPLASSKLSNRGQPRATETAMVEAAWDRSSSRGAQACTVPCVLCGGRQPWGTKRGKADCRPRPPRFAPRRLRAERPSGRRPVTCLSRAPAWVANPGER